MDLSVVSTVITVAEKIYTTAQAVQQNKKQCLRMSARVNAVKDSLVDFVNRLPETKWPPAVTRHVGILKM